MRTPTAKILCFVLGLTAASTVGVAADGIPPRQVADMLYELAFANRKVYTRDIVQRLGNASVVRASEHYLDAKGLPLPAQIFRLAAEEIETEAYWLSLRSLTPINFANGPLTLVEEQGLEYVKANPDKAFYANDHSAGAPSLVAIYADVASVQACVTCHNAHPHSPRRDFELGDVMGGVIIRLFLPE